jgi:hypothetical protein
VCIAAVKYMNPQRFETAYIRGLLVREAISHCSNARGICSLTGIFGGRKMDHGAQSGGARVISAEQARDIFLARQTCYNPGLAARLASEVGITAKAVRDIWALRTWRHATRGHWTQADREASKRKQEQPKLRARTSAPRPGMVLQGVDGRWLETACAHGLGNRAHFTNEEASEKADRSAYSESSNPKCPSEAGSSAREVTSSCAWKKEDSSEAQARPDQNGTETWVPVGNSSRTETAHGSSVSAQASQCHSSLGEGETVGRACEEWMEDAYQCFQDAAQDFDQVLDYLGSLPFPQARGPLLSCESL